MLHQLIFLGGLGNQMFQYALVLALRNKGFRVKLDTSFFQYEQMHNGYELNRVFGICEELECKKGIHLFWLRLIRRYFSSFFISTDPLTYFPEILEHPKRYICGYWQNEQYFNDIESDIRKAFVFQNIDERNRSLAKEMQSCNSVSLHIRRGDYAAFGMTIVGEDYYAKAISCIKEKVETPVFFIFSDDQEEAEQIVRSQGVSYQMVTGNREDNSYKDMYLMSQCKHNIIANSSFSWWGAWLNNSPQKMVIAPKCWDVKQIEFSPQVKNWTLV